MKVVKVLINTSVKSLNKVYDYLVPITLEDKVEIGKRVEVSFGRKNEEGIIVKLYEETKEDLNSRKYKLKEITNILDEISYIDEKKLKLAKYISYIYFCNVYDALKLMLPPGTSSKKSNKSLNTKQDIYVKVIKSEYEITQEIESGVIKSGNHIRLLKFLLENDNVLINDLIDGLGISRSVINTVKKNGYIEFIKKDKKVDLLKNIKVERTYKLNPTNEQKVVIDSISKDIDIGKYKQILIHGVTGSGKTEVYLQLIEKVLSKNKKVIVLVPEISLTYQTVVRFVSRFGNNIAILHSKMTIAQRKEEYKRIKNNEVDIVIGARSAIFAPLDNIGLVIIDEEHDSSYYSSTTPKYSTKDIASYICKQNNAILVLGSATPEVTTYYKAKNGQIDLYEMKNRPGVSVLPEVELVDMKEERLFGNKSIFSNLLKDEIRKNIERNEQTMIFLNRRGYSSYLKCNDCSYIFKCNNCDVAMTYHKSNNLLLCHYCMQAIKNVDTCPMCGSQNISSSTIGTQKVEEELNMLYPGISILRMDADTTITKDAHQKILDEFMNKNINVLVGTQMISKGHDIPNVTLVGILGADSMLSMNDYLASEKAFSNISQVSGRAGRKDKKGRVIIQTIDVDNKILQAVKDHSYNDFYENEISFRKNFLYPPFQDLIIFELISNNQEELKKESNILYNILKEDIDNLYKVFSPKSPYIQKINNKFRIYIVVKTIANTKFYNNIYIKINKFNKIKNKNISFIISKNPHSMIL